jgi:hypothetical protein
MLTQIRPLLLSSLFAFPLAGCAVDDLEPPSGGCPIEGRYMPVSTGASWTYRVDDGQITAKTQTVGPLEDVGGSKAGIRAYRMTTTKPGGETISWQEDTGHAIRRHRELDLAGSNHSDEIYSPYKTRIDESAGRITEGATWSESFDEVSTDTDDVTTATSKIETWVVEEVDEVVAVPAGTFCAMRLLKTSVVGGEEGSTKRYWFARGVGKIKEVGANQTEELTSHTVE